MSATFTVGKQSWKLIQSPALGGVIRCVNNKVHKTSISLQCDIKQSSVVGKNHIGYTRHIIDGFCINDATSCNI